MANPTQEKLKMDINQKVFFENQSKWQSSRRRSWRWPASQKRQIQQWHEHCRRGEWWWLKFDFIVQNSWWPRTWQLFEWLTWWWSAKKVLMCSCCCNRNLRCMLSDPLRRFNRKSWDFDKLLCRRISSRSIRKHGGKPRVCRTNPYERHEPKYERPLW